MLTTDSRATAAAESQLLGESAAMAAVRAQVARVAASAASVVVTGPSGSGKECVARALHLASPRSAGPFVAINCGAVPRELIESELFGHERGAFTGAHAQRAGRFEQAHGGTLFLDEVGDMPPDMQVKLLRVLEERAVERVGGTRSIPVEVRVVCATHRSFAAEIAAGRFREDLFWRLAVVPIELPPLSARRDDLPALVRHFARTPGGDARVTFAPAALDRLAVHDWPGNVRELRNVVERAAILHGGETVAADAVDALLHRGTAATPIRPAAGALGPNVLGRGVDLPAEVARLEVEYIRAALGRSEGVVAEAARLLGLRRTTLIEKMRRYALERSEPHASATGAIASSAA